MGVEDPIPSRIDDSYGLFIAFLFLLMQVGGVLLLIFDKQYVSLIISNPILFVGVGMLICYKKIVYVASNVSAGTYSIVRGKPAQTLGFLLVTIGLLSGLLFNIPYFNAQVQTAYLWFGQFIVSMVVIVFMAIKYGEMTHSTR